MCTASQEDLRYPPEPESAQLQEAPESTSLASPEMVTKMKNPWTKKNPFMSRWLSGANAAIGSARGHATAAAKRESKEAASTVTTAGTEQVLAFWANMLKPPATRRKPRR